MANERYSEFTEETPKTFVQGLFEESSTQKHKLGTIRRLSDGREFVYCKMGGTNGVAGQVYQGAVVDANVANVAVANANVGDRTIAVTPVTVLAGDAAANTFAEGFAHITTGGANGMAYKIKSHGALTANTAANFVLYDKLRSANLATSKVTLTRHPAKGVIVQDSPPTAGLVGVCTFPVTANYFAWLQKRGPCPCEVDGTIVVGDVAICSAAANGCVSPRTANTGLETEIAVGHVIYAAANDLWALIDLKL